MLNINLNLAYKASAAPSTETAEAKTPTLTLREAWLQAPRATRAVMPPVPDASGSIPPLEMQRMLQTLNVSFGLYRGDPIRVS